jgi:hypothetical protein
MPTFNQEREKEMLEPLVIVKGAPPHKVEETGC